MSGLEQAIRNALERAERSNPEIRSRIYQSARNALDAGLRKQEIEDLEQVARQRQRLEATIRMIEDEELERLRSIARLEKVIVSREPDDLDPEMQLGPPGEPQSQPESPREKAPKPEVDRPAEPSASPTGRMDADDGSLSNLSMRRDDAPRSMLHEDENPAWSAPGTPEANKTPKKMRSAGRRTSSFFVAMFVYVVLFGAIGSAFWWVWATGMLDAALKGTGDFDLVPKELQSESFDPAEKKSALDPMRGFSGEWIEVFNPKDADSVVARANAEIGTTKDGDGDAVTIASGAPDQDGDVLIDVPASILQDMVGRSSTLALTVSALGDKPAQIYVQCEFAELGGCGRHRFTVTTDRTDNLLRVTFDRTLAPEKGGKIVINTDLDGEGGAIKLYGIRFLPGT
ncbi:MAG: hypothetical protein RLZZ444_791 [Pseudomonadota bacterium]